MDGTLSDWSGSPAIADGFLVVRLYILEDGGPGGVRTHEPRFGRPPAYASSRGLTSPEPRFRVWRAYLS